MSVAREVGGPRYKAEHRATVMKPINSLPKRQQSESRIDRSANPMDDPRVEVWSDPQAAGNPQADADQKGGNYKHTGGQLLSAEQVSETSFPADDVPAKLSERRKQLLQRIWRVDRGLDVDPGDATLGAEVGHYADSTVDTEIVSSFDRFKHHLADTCLQQMELPQSVRDHVLHLIDNRPLRRFNRHGGIDGAIVGLTMRTLAGHLNLQKVADLEDTDWWPRIRSIADELKDVMGTIERTFGQIIELVEKDYCGESGGPT